MSPITRSLQIGRKVVPNEEFTDWFLKSGFQRSNLESLHVTIAYSKTPVDWSAPVFEPKNGSLQLAADPFRSFKVFDGFLKVLTIQCSTLSIRWSELCAAGASWDFDNFIPHISLGVETAKSQELRPFQGQILLGPEYRKETR